jgi:uncharacterized membrane protein YgcG
VLAVLAVGGFLVVRAFAPEIAPVLTGSGCVATGDHQSILLDTEQGSIAATIAGVAHQQAMPRVAVTIAYATAMQESKLHNLDYGDRDSVGVFQQRPSEGWGPRKDLEDPIYASAKFFRALRTVPGYRKMPVYQAAQAVQHSADGAAYTQYEKMAAAMTPAFTGQRGHAVYCWSGSDSRAPANVRGITSGLGSTFGPAMAAAASEQVTQRRDSRSSATGGGSSGAGGSGAGGGSVRMQVRVGPRFGWEVATWLVTHASTYHIHQIRFGGYQWRAAASGKGWVRDAGAPPAGRLELS